MPEPPNLEPPELDLIIGTKIDVRDPTLRLTGAPGAAPPGATVWAVCFSWWSEPDTTVAADDGSFEFLVTGYDGSQSRIQTRREDLRSTPLDVILREEASPELIEWEPCLGVDPPHELNLGETTVGGESTTGHVVIRNECSSDLELTIPPLYLGGFDFSVTAESPQNISVGDEARFELSFEPEAEGDLEEILLLEVGEPLAERRPVTIFGHALP